LYAGEERSTSDIKSSRVVAIGWHAFSTPSPRAYLQIGICQVTRAR
jgi:hypothetical protein